MKRILFAALLCAMTSLTGCDKLKDAVSRDIKVNNVKFEFNATASDNMATSSAAVATKAGGMDNSFTVTRSVNISELGNSDLEEYASKINKIMVNSSLLNITTVPAGSYSVSDVTITAVGVTGSLSIASYTLGGVFTPPANMISYTIAFVDKLLHDKTITVTVTGKTDAPSGTVVNVSYESDMVFTVSLI